ncbi:MAG: DNA polymerase III subunit gamma/tau [Lachnospiraceae bacterium]|uniref:DNA-directed DNA polymerase n=1 Tax=Candidatus Weimeria bifida TaxID=2599074 RepID=A0A6N7J2W4_9FIRM|nr:DNA polymerase III subunit gamma/tau [Candidatus Weimeria bifida]RRF96857.1 MAG: DNA polymerase III subunit gamma/tau [Lachnospiraceae bacterium]
MAYMALYRKFRPQKFSDVKGQDHIVTTLKNELKAGRIGHAYLFTGTRGTGKTTVAKIFARAVNCEHPLPDGSPCGECDTCRAIAEGASMNVMEIDAASNNGVENIRSIIEDVEYPPAAGKYKVYIIDEVHMLSPGAFNAFLKTLEEPPSYVIFILATTELQKIPVTILSRCQRYDFHRISVDVISARLGELCEKEGVKASDEALNYVARAGDGSMRDALSLLDQCINFYLGEELTYDKVLSVLGAVDTEVLSRIYNAIVDIDIAGVCRVIDSVMTEGRDLNSFVSDFVWYLRDMLLYKNAPGMADTFDMTYENKKRLFEDSDKLSAEAMIRYIRILSDLENQMRFAQDKRVLLEVSLIRLMHPEMDSDNYALVNRIDELEHRIDSGDIQVKNAAVQQAEPVEITPLPTAVPEDLKEAKSVLNDVAKTMAGSFRAGWGDQRHQPFVENDKLVVYFDNKRDLNICNKDFDAFSAKLNQILGKQVPIEFKFNEKNQTFQKIDDPSRDMQQIIGTDMPIDIEEDTE